MEQYIVEGNISVKAVLLAQKRDIIKIIVDEKKKDRDTAFILRQAAQRNIPIRQTAVRKLLMACTGKKHAAAVTSAPLPASRHTFRHCRLSLKRIQFFWRDRGWRIANFRLHAYALYAAGCDGVIIPPRNWTTAAGVVTKASAGASEYLNLIVATDMEALLQEMKQADIQLICAQRKDAISLYDYAFPLSCVWQSAVKCGFE